MDIFLGATWKKRGTPLCVITCISNPNGPILKFLIFLFEPENFMPNKSRSKLSDIISFALAS